PGVVADVLGRRTSYLLGSATLFVSTLLYLLLWRLHGPFPAWALVSILLGLGFTFFTGATEAWLVDGLRFANYRGTLEAAFARGQIATGIAILAGAQIVGGALVPYAGRVFRRRTTLLLAGSVTSAAALALIGLAPNFVAALALMGLWALVFAATMPVRQAFINALIPSEERA